MAIADVVALAAPASDRTTRVAWTAAFLAWLCAVPMYAVTKFLDTVAHEGGHALVATLLFQRAGPIRIFRDGGGSTGTPPAMPWIVELPVALAGYLGPSLFGLIAAELVVRGHVRLTLWASLGFLALMLLTLRGWFGWLLVPALMVLIGYVVTSVRPEMQELFAYVWVWLLLIGAVETMLRYMSDRTYRAQGSDTARLRELTLLPSGFWGFLLLAGTIAALVRGSVVLLHLTG